MKKQLLIWLEAQVAVGWAVLLILLGLSIQMNWFKVTTKVVQLMPIITPIQIILTMLHIPQVVRIREKYKIFTDRLIINQI